MWCCKKYKIFDISVTFSKAPGTKRGPYIIKPMKARSCTKRQGNIGSCLPSWPVMYRSQSKKQIQLRPETTSKEILPPEDQEKRWETSSSAVVSNKEPLSNRAAPNISSFARLAREKKGFLFFLMGAASGAFGKFLGIPSRRVKFTRTPTGKLRVIIVNLCIFKSFWPHILKVKHPSPAGVVVDEAPE